MKHIKTQKIYEDAQKVADLNQKIRDLDKKKTDIKIKAADTAKKQREENYPGYYARHGQTDSMRRNSGYPHDKLSRTKNKALRQQEMYLSKTNEE